MRGHRGVTKGEKIKRTMTSSRELSAKDLVTRKKNLVIVKMLVFDCVFIAVTLINELILA